MTTTVPGALLSAGAAIANLGFTPMANTQAAVNEALGFTPGAALGFTPANKAGDTFTGPTIHAAAYTVPSAIAFSATAMAVTCDSSNVFTTTLTANVTVAPTFTSPNDGQTINWFLTQDATGSRTMTWPTSFKWPAGTPVALSTVGNSVDMLVATYRATPGHWYAALTKDLR